MHYILHIDDNDIDRIILSRSLKKQFRELNIVSLESAALAETYLNDLLSAGKQVPDLIITDNNMPEKTGFQFVEYLKSAPTLNHIPIVMLSSSSLENDIERAYKLGVLSYMVKPLNPNAIMHISDFLKEEIKS